MNRKQRRTAKATNLLQPLSREAAVHEAGHAVARILTARDFGLDAANCVVRIDVHQPELDRSNLIEGALPGYGVQAVCYGKMFSAEINQFLASYFPNNGYVRATPQERIEAFAKARQLGLNVEGWLRGRLLIDVFGAAAEAKVLGAEVSAIWEAPSSYNDMKEAFFSAIMAGVESDRIEMEISNALDRAVAKLAMPEVWNAVLAVADLLPSTGTVSGRKIYNVAARELGAMSEP